MGSLEIKRTHSRQVGVGGLLVHMKKEGEEEVSARYEQTGKGGGSRLRREWGGT